MPKQISSQSSVATILAIVSLSWAAGCGSAGPDVQFVRGVVTLDGNPVDGCLVVFSPEEAGGLAAAGTTDAKGRFQLNSRNSQRFGQGAIAGPYRVTLSKLEGKPADDEGRETSATAPTIPKELMPLVYTSKQTTPLRATVVKGTNEFTFALESNGH